MIKYERFDDKNTFAPQNYWFENVIESLEIKKPKCLLLFVISDNFFLL